VSTVAAGRPADPDRRTYPRLLSVAGALFVAAIEVQRVVTGSERGWIAFVAFAAIAAWLLSSALPSRIPLAARLTLLGVALAGGSLVASATEVLGFAPAIAAILLLLSRPSLSIWWGCGAAVLSLLLMGVGALLRPVSAGLLLGLLAGLVIVVLVGLSRRQFRVGEEQTRLLLEQRIAVEHERAEVAALAERSRIARDIHDVLAHSLGGLVLQLDAVDALLDSGHVAEAAGRVRAARVLAGEGLDEARRAVDALRDPDAAADPAQAIEQLIATHRSLGAAAELRETGSPGALSPDATGALRRAAQEALSNARRHAPGMPTELSLDWTARDVALRATTALAPGASAPSPGGGRGLAGMSERMSALGGSATAGIRGSAFVVEARLPRSVPA